MRTFGHLASTGDINMSNNRKCVGLKCIGLLGIPFDDNSSFERGPAKAPAIVRQVLTGGSLNGGTENGLELRNNEKWIDCDDIIISDNDQFVQTIEQRCDDLLSQNTRLLTLGGDHSISYPIMRSYAKLFPKLTILHIDAHTDL